MRWTLKVTAWVQHSIDSHPFNSMEIGHPIPEIWLFQNFSKIQGQGHGWGECWKSQSGCNILSIHIAVVPCQSAIRFLRYSIFKIFIFFYFFIANTKIEKTIQIQHTQQRFDTMPTNKDLLHVQPNVCASNLLRQTTQYHIDVTFILPYSFHFNCDYPCEIHVIAFHTWRVISSHDDHHTYIC